MVVPSGCDNVRHSRRAGMVAALTNVKANSRKMDIDFIG